MYGNRPVPASEALALKRAVAKAAYGAGDQLKKTGDVVAGNFGAGLSHFERAVDDALDQALGPQFEQANLTFRRLLGASQAAERGAARSQTNHLLGLLHTGAAGVGAVAHGPSGAIAGGLASLLFDKYGSQAGARLLYSPVGGGLGMVGRGLQALPGALSSGVAAEKAAPGAVRLGDLLESLMARPAVGDEGSRRPALAQGGSP
jgi:hypothetical protein